MRRLTDGSHRTRQIREVEKPQEVALVRVGNRYGRKELLRVWVTRIRENGTPRPHFDDLAEVHHRHTVADALDDAHVVRDEKEGEPHFFLELHHEIDHLRSDRDVERRNAFVGNDDFGLQCERTRNADALALTAREFVRIAVAHIGREADAL